MGLRLPRPAQKITRPRSNRVSHSVPPDPKARTKAPRVSSSYVASSLRFVVSDRRSNRRSGRHRSPLVNRTRPTRHDTPTEHARAPLSRAPCASKTAAQIHLAYALTVLFPPGAAGANFLGPPPACALRAWRLAPEACVLAFARAALRRADITPPRHAQRKHLGLKPSMPSHLKHGMPNPQRKVYPTRKDHSCLRKAGREGSR